MDLPTGMQEGPGANPDGDNDSDGTIGSDVICK